MKYLKVYEYYNSDGFEEVDDPLFNSMSRNGRFNFKDSEIHEIITNFSEFKCDSISSGKILIYDQKFNIIITKFDDEWFGVSTKNIKYKCDQFDSVINCLKHITNHK